MNKGFLRLPREAFNHWTFNDPVKWRAFIDLLGMAAYKAQRKLVNGKIINLQIGEIVATGSFLECRWGLSRSLTRTFLKNLKLSQDIDQRTDQGLTILIVAKHWLEGGVLTKDSPEDDRALTNGSPAVDQQVDHNLRIKEGKKGRKEELILSPPAERILLKDQIEEIYQAYLPTKKTDKDKCLKIIKAALKSKSITAEDFLKRVFAHTQMWKQKEKQGDSIQFCRSSSSWFYQSGWEDGELLEFISAGNKIAAPSTPGQPAQNTPKREPSPLMLETAYDAAWPVEDYPRRKRYSPTDRFWGYDDEERHKLMEAHPPLKGFLKG